jgi:hypothetical protein
MEPMLPNEPRFVNRLPKEPILRIIMDADETVDEMEMLSVELFILELKSDDSFFLGFMPAELSEGKVVVDVSASG